MIKHKKRAARASHYIASLDDSSAHNALDEMTILLVTEERFKAFRERFNAFHQCFVFGPIGAFGTDNVRAGFYPTRKLLKFIAAVRAGKFDNYNGNFFAHKRIGDASNDQALLRLLDHDERKETNER